MNWSPHRHPQCFLCSPFFTAVTTHTYTHTPIFPKQLKKQRWSSHFAQIKLQFIFKLQPQFTLCTSSDFFRTILRRWPRVGFFTSLLEMILEKIHLAEGWYKVVEEVSSKTVFSKWRLNVDRSFVLPNFVSLKLLRLNEASLNNDCRQAGQRLDQLV